MKRGIVEVLTKTAAFVALSFTGIANAKTPVDAVARQGSGIIRTFMAAVHACGARPSVTPKLIVKTRPDLVSYSSEDNSVHLSRWNDLPPQVKELVTAWSKQSTLNLSPSAMFSEIFDSLLVPHELGHYLQTASARSQKLDHWQSETEANQIAIAFWSRIPDGKRTIGERVANFEKFLGKLPSPVPAGADPHAYFELNYKKLSSDAAAYGWYQGAFMRTAWHRGMSTTLWMGKAQQAEPQRQTKVVRPKTDHSESHRLLGSRHPFIYCIALYERLASGACKAPERSYRRSRTSAAAFLCIAPWPRLEHPKFGRLDACARRRCGAENVVARRLSRHNKAHGSS